MSALGQTALSGWIAALAFVGVAVLPIVLRRFRLSDLVRARAMRIHYVAAFAVAAVVTLHAFAPTTAKFMRSLNAEGLWLATAAWLLILTQLAVGFSLRGAQGRKPTLRAVHFVIMSSALVLIAAHIALLRV